MMYNKALIDTNVCLDAAQRRKPFHTNALMIIELVQANIFSGLIVAHSFDTLFYILNKSGSKKAAYTVLSGFRRTFSVASVTQSVIDRAISANWNDFEDAIHYYAAMQAGCDAIVTRNAKDFKKAELPILTPQTFLNQFG